MEKFRSILSIRSRAMLCFLVGVCVSPVLVQWLQTSMLGARANEYEAFVQEPESGKDPIAIKTLPTQPAGETSLPNDEKEVTDATIPSDPKEVVRFFFESNRKNDQSKMSQVLSSGAREELKRKQIEFAFLGSAKATFKVLNAVEESDRTLVKSVWEEPKPSDETTLAVNNKSSEIIWELRKESQGWRICGMAIDPKDGTEVQVINFEKLELPKRDTKQALLSPADSTSFDEFDSGVHSDPKDVTKFFVAALRRGDGALAWAFLSTRSKLEMKWNGSFTNLNDFMGIANGVFVVSDQEPVKRDGCMFVTSTFAGSAQAGQSGKGREFVWKLRWESKGWRIFGYTLDPKTNPTTKDFEEPVSSAYLSQSTTNYSRTTKEYAADIDRWNSMMSTKASTAFVSPPQSNQNRPAVSQDFELDAEVISEIKAIVKLSADRNGNTLYQISKLREVSLQSIAHSGSGLETYAQIQEVLTRTVTWYQAEKDETSRTELHASAIKLANILFHLQQLKRKSEIGGIEKRLGKLKEMVATREKMSEQIVNSRVNQLLGISDGMGWDDLKVRQPQPDSTTSH